MDLKLRGRKEFQGLLKNFKFHCLFSLQLGVRRMLLAVAPESSEKSLHPTSMPDCMQRLGVRGKVSSHFWVSAGEASQEERQNPERGTLQQKPGIRARGGQNKCESPRTPKGLGWGVGRPWTSLSGLYHKGQVALGDSRVMSPCKPWGGGFDGFYGNLYLTAQPLSQLGFWGWRPIVVSLTWPLPAGGVLAISVSESCVGSFPGAC